MGSDFYGTIACDVDLPSEDVQKYMLATSDFSRGIQDDINHYVTRDRINNASFRQKLDPIAKNILRRQNPLELVFQEISTFDAENPIAGLLLRKLDVGKKDTASKLIKKAPQPPRNDYLIQNRLNKLRNTGNDNNNNNNGLSLAPSFFQPPSPQSSLLPPFFSPQPPLPPPIFNNFQPPSLPANQQPTLFNIPLPPPPPPPPPSLLGSQTMTAVEKPKEKGEEKIIDKFDTTIYEMPDPPKIELGDSLLNTLGTRADDILADDFINNKDIEQK